MSFNIEQFRNYCLNKKGTEETFPFDESTLVMKLRGKMYALTDIDDQFSITLKIDPEYSIELKEKYEAISDAYHMNKKHWINYTPDNSLSEKEIYKLIDDSYNLIKNKLTKKAQKELDKL
ncbi:MAG: MmcQ/YjbR family DNA-binding protein [Bacteroidota bacterium]|nr:MmcQ/YjbR family DNA-binding protein [Bacteroidota bacterium]